MPTKKIIQDDEQFLGKENEWLFVYCNEILEKQHFDYFIFGHRHLPLEIQLKEDSIYINLGDWLQYFTYLEYDGDKATLKKWNKTHEQEFKNFHH